MNKFYRKKKPTKNKTENKTENYAYIYQKYTK